MIKAAAAKKIDPAQVALELENVTVSFRSYKERPTTLKESLLSFVKKGQVKYYSTFDALKDISFNVNRGEAVGIIGSNGAGKSTLLKTIAGVISPTQGSVKARGKLDSFIQLGAGFDAELSAIENIYLNCALHKIPHSQIKSRIPHILEFAELNDFANTPIKYYSSGMFARLGFSVAIEREPDILLVDEVLAVGDERFQLKSQEVFNKYLTQGKTIVMVSHDLKTMESVCSKIILLSKGKIVYMGDPSTALSKYRDKTYETALV